MTRFCVISRDYEHHVPREHNPDDITSTSIRRGLASLGNQTFQDFNVVICHDGPKQKTYEQEGIDFEELGIQPYQLFTPKHQGLWGHPSADYAMRFAYEHNLGDYYIQHNIDNEFFPEAFEKIDKALNKIKEDILIFQIYHWKIYPLTQDIDAMENPWIGIPPVRQYIDSMQLVAHKDIWKSVGFWHSNEEESDGIIYEDMCKRFPYRYLPLTLGHNF